MRAGTVRSEVVFSKLGGFLTLGLLRGWFLIACVKVGGGWEMAVGKMEITTAVIVLVE